MNFSRGLGQLEAYIHAEEGVAFEMDNKLIWNTFSWTFQSLYVKVDASKFRITPLPSGKIMLKDWRGTYLAAMPVGVDPNSDPVFPVSYSTDESLHFEVFYRDNKVAFRAYNGLFLARVFRTFHTVEAAKRVADDSCCFRPMIGDVYPPVFKILRMQISDLSTMQYGTYVIKKETFINRSDELQPHTFCLTWETAVTDRIVWNELWGLGLPVSARFTIGDTKATLKYTEDNDRVVYVTRRIYEECTEDVIVPPKRMCIARLLVNKYHNAAFAFRATIRKEKSNALFETLEEQGAWIGLLYSHIWMDIVTYPVLEPCTTM